MKIDSKEVNYISKLAKLKLTEEEIKKMADEFESILTHFECIDKFELRDTEPNLVSKNLKPVYRKDEIKIFEDKKKLFQNVKCKKDDYIKVPKIIE